MWNEEVKRHGLEDASLKRVIWKSIRFRVLINIILYLSSILFGFIGPVNNMLQCVHFHHAELRMRQLTVQMFSLSFSHLQSRHSMFKTPLAKTFLLGPSFRELRTVFSFPSRFLRRAPNCTLVSEPILAELQTHPYASHTLLMSI